MMQDVRERAVKEIIAKREQIIINKIREKGYKIDNNFQSVQNFIETHDIKWITENKKKPLEKTLYINDEKICKWSDEITSYGIKQGKYIMTITVG